MAEPKIHALAAFEDLIAFTLDRLGYCKRACYEVLFR